MRITFSDGRPTHIVFAAVLAVHAGVRVAGSRGTRMRRLLVGMLPAALVAAAVGAA